MKKTKERLQMLTEELNEYVGKDEERLDERVAGSVEDALNDVLLPLVECESPIERIFALDLYKYFNRSFVHHIVDVFEITHQQEVKANGNEYRVDFLIDYADAKTEKAYQFVVECDGHEFHQKTKEQVEKDKQRDRDFMAEGIVVIRFTGSEIYANPAKSARETMKIIHKFLSQYEKK